MGRSEVSKVGFQQGTVQFEAHSFCGACGLAGEQLESWFRSPMGEL